MTRCIVWYAQQQTDTNDFLVMERHVSASFKPWKPPSSSPRLLLRGKGTFDKGRNRLCSLIKLLSHRRHEGLGVFSGFVDMLSCRLGSWVFAVFHSVVFVMDVCAVIKLSTFNASRLRGVEMSCCPCHLPMRLLCCPKMDETHDPINYVCFLNSK